MNNICLRDFEVTNKRDTLGQIPHHLKTQFFKETAAKLEKSAKEKVMRAGSLVVRQVSQTAILEEERAKLISLRLKASRLGIGTIAPGDGAAGASATAATDAGSRTRDVWVQTEDDAEARRRELARLRCRRDELLVATRNVPKNTANMVELLKKRNAVLLAREERALQRARSERQEKEQRVKQLKERLANLTATKK